jgi:hypothetical protein
MNVNSNNSTVSQNPFLDKANAKVQEKGIEAIQKTLKNDKLDDTVKKDLVQAQMEAFGVTQKMLDKASGEDTTKKSDTTSTDTTTKALQPLNKMQEGGLEIIQKTLQNSKIDDETKKKMLSAQMQAFGVTQEMIDKNSQDSTKATDSSTTDSTTQTAQQKDGMDTLTNTLSAKISDADKKDLLKKIVEDYKLTQSMVNQSIEGFANGNQDKYIQARVMLGSNMGFSAMG